MKVTSHSYYLQSTTFSLIFSHNHTLTLNTFLIKRGFYIFGQNHCDNLSQLLIFKFPSDNLASSSTEIFSSMIHFCTPGNIRKDVFRGYSNGVQGLNGFMEIVRVGHFSKLIFRLNFFR